MSTAHPWETRLPEPCSTTAAAKHGYGQVSPTRDSSGSRSHRATLVWLARFPPRDRLQSLSVGRKRKDRRADSPILRHAKPHVTKDRYIKAFDPAVLEAMQWMQATVDVLEKSPAGPAVVQQMN